jgi:hypothetical protein
MRRASGALLLLVVLQVTATAAEAVSADSPLAPERVRQLMQDRKYAEAVTALDEVLAAKPPAADYLLWLKARAMGLADRHDEALAVLEGLEKQYPQSPWIRQARFTKAIVLVRKNDFRAAELIYRSEAEYLLSTERKQQIAAIYLEFADVAFKPPQEDQQPDYQKAMDFYRQALEVGPQPEKRAEVELRVAECLQNLKQFDPAIADYERFVKEHPRSPLNLEAGYRLGQCRLAQGDAKGARRAWQDLLARYPDARSDRIAEAMYYLAQTWGLPQPETNEALNLGVAALESFIERFPQHKLAPQALLDMAAAQMHRQHYDDAAGALKRLLANPRYQDREEIAQARSLLGRTYLMQKKFTEALATWHEYLTLHPTHKDWSAVQQEIINTEYLMGSERMEAKDYPAARKLWSEFLVKYPLDGRYPGILLQFGRMSYLEEHWQGAIADWQRLVSKFPQREEAAEAQLAIAQTLEEKLGKLEEALEEYRKVKGPGSAPGRAQQAIQRLTAKSMSIATGRTFRSDETPKLRLESRNIESLTVRAYSVDLETYFRKMHLARGVEELDIALISPDKTFEYKLPDYVKYQSLERKIDVPLPGEKHAGVMAVTVSSTTLEATTLVIQSDLDVIVKSSRDELFVFAQNMRSGKPWPGVRLLVSDGKQVFAEAVTGTDGVWKQSYKELQHAEDIRVLAVADGNVASNNVELRGVQVARGLADKGYLFTDRPAYRAGELVHVRGCIRRAAGDAYTIEANKSFTLTASDSRGRLVHETKVTLSAMGTFHTYFTLPPACPQGEYAIAVRDDASQQYQGSFVVHQQQIEPVRLTVDVPRHVYYRGEEIEGTIRAAFYYGAPLADREIRYQLADDRSYTATTDAKGEVHFKLPTREFLETQILPLAVMLPERNLQTTVQFFLATQGFSMDVKSLRPVYVAGETFEVSVTARDAESKPLATKLTLKVLEQTVVEGRIGERLVEEHPLETAAADGLARQTLKLEQGGRYVLRAEAIDRFKNLVTGQSVLQISDDQDEVRLRILADRHTYKAGETAAVEIHWREEPALALVCFQGARVLDYQLISLQKGPNRLPIRMTAALAPNFELSVDVMTDRRDNGSAGPRAGEGASRNSPRPLAGEGQGVRALRRLHSAASGFTVERDLRVAMAWKPTENLRPGAEIEVTFTTTDPTGKPVPAELSLAMVEQALLERFAANSPAIQDYFRGELRQAAVRTASSITFAYQPATHPIDARLLAEQDRLEVSKEEAASREKDAGVAFLGDNPVAHADDAAWHDRRADPNSHPAPGLSGSSPRPGISEEEEERLAGVPVARLRTVITSAGPVAWNGRGFGGRKAASKRHPAMIDGNEKAERGFLPLADLGVAWGVDNRPEPSGVQVAEGDIGEFFKQSGAAQREVLVLHRDGRVHSLNLATWGALEGKGIEALAKDLAASGAVLLPTAQQATGYWNPVITTGADGKATVTVALPERSTAWRLLAKGITSETLAGEASGDLAVKKDLFGELKLPLAFTDGDTAQITAGIHSDALPQGPVEVVLKTTIGNRSSSERKTLAFKAPGLQEVLFKASLQRPAEQAAGTGEVAVLFELTVSAGERRDVVRRSVPLLPYGMPVFVTKGGSATSDTTDWIEAPKEMPLDCPTLQILVGPTAERSLLDIVLTPACWCQLEASRMASGMETLSSDLLASVSLQKLLQGSRQAEGPDAQAIAARIRGAIGQLISDQDNDGGWSWTGRVDRSDPIISARAVWALSLARAAGNKVPEAVLQKGIAYLRNQTAESDNNDYETKAVLLHALSTAGAGDFALANRLHRDRPQLSPAALLYVALALAEMNRPPMALEMLALAEKQDFEAPVKRLAGQARVPRSHSPTELRALYALALQKVAPTSAKLKEQIDWLLAHRTGYRWMPDRATGPAAMAECGWFGQSRFSGERYRLTIFVNDKQAQVLDVDPAAGTQTVDVTAALLRPGKQRIHFQITGRGRYTYQCVLGGFVPAEQLKGTVPSWQVQRTYEPAPRELDGREIPRGFGPVVGAYTSFRNPLTQLPVGSRAQVEIRFARSDYHDNLGEAAPHYIVVTEPIPCGATVIEKSVRGEFERFEISPGAITFYLTGRTYQSTLAYELHGYLPGGYRAAPTVIHDAYRPEHLAVGPAMALAVLPPGAVTHDAYRLTPQELYEFGKRYFEKGDFPAAQTHLTELVEKWNIRADVFKEAVRMLLDAHLQIGPPAKVVHYFEIVKERWPAEEIPFDKILKVGAAYDEVGEYERSYLIFRATVESSFGRESNLAGFLEGQGEFLRSVEVMGRLLQQYPPEGYLAAAQYALAQRVYAKAPDAANDAKLRQKKVNRIDLLQRAWTMLEGFLTAYPDDPAADQAAFSTANALLEMKAYDRAAAACDRYAGRYPQSDLLDSYWYIIGYSRFATGQHEKALEMCRKVADAKRLNKQTGSASESPNKWRALYILGQVYHSLGQAAEAIAEYRRVEDRFADAKEAIAYFLHKSIELPEVTTVKPGEPVEVELKFRNIAESDVKVYSIDLMKFSLLRRSLGEITHINLAGIHPYHEARAALGDGRDYRDRTHKLPLPLKEEGAYLVVCRGDDLHASGLVLVTPLGVEAQEDTASGRVRITVKDLAAGRYLNDVHVKVIGSRNADFVSGSTDLRGVFIADGIKGTSTAIAQLQASRYAFFRGTTELVPEVPVAAAQSAQQQAQDAVRANAPPKPNAQLDQQLLEGLQQMNSSLQVKQVENLKQLYGKQQKGVEAQKAK